METLNFVPFWGLSSRHLQIIISAYAPAGEAPPTQQWLVDIGDGDKLSCEVSTPPDWDGKTVVAMVHGFGGSHNSSYMVRMARKFYQKRYKVVRINLRNCGSGEGLTKKPSGAGNSKDILEVVKQLKKETPHADLYLIGFSLGGNTILKLAGELGDVANALVKAFIAICPPLDLEETVRFIQKPNFFIYHNYYLKGLRKMGKPWIKEPVQSIMEYDEKITAPMWGFENARDYYTKCSCIRFLERIKSPCHIVLAQDDPFVSVDVLKQVALPESLHIWISQHGSHQAFLGRTVWQWLDYLLLNWLEGNFKATSV